MLRWIQNDYNSEEQKLARHDKYIADLQAYVNKNNILSDDTDSIFEWINRNTRVYLFFYKDGKLFIDNFDKNESDKPSAPEGGVGVDDDFIIQGNKLTREEILAKAEESGLLPVEFEDGTLLVSLFDNSENYYRNAANILSILVGFVTFTLIITLYFNRITVKMHRLAKDVSVVYESDMNYKIRTDSGNDELSDLGRNVEKMRVSMLESIEKKNEALDANTDLITSMSHDIRTPLTVLLGYIDIMKECSDNETMDEYLKAAGSTAMKLKELSDDMFKYFLVIGSNVSVDMMDYDARMLVEQFISEHILLLEERGYEVNSEVSIPEGETVSTDAPKLMRVFENLFSNIYKYADSSKPITLRAVSEGGEIIIEAENYISDTKDEAESNCIGLRTVKKLCELTGARFEYCELDGEGGRIFRTVLQIDIKVK